MEEHSLEEFLDAGRDEETGEHGSSEPGETADPAETDSTVATARWRGEDGECGQCGVGASRLWNDDGTFVCRACKEW